MIGKMCSCCKKGKSYEEFSLQSNSPDGHKYTCRECDNKRGRIYYKKDKKANPEKYKLKSRKSSLMYLYKVTPKQYDRLYNKQKGCCAICGKHQSEFKRSLNVDHNHETGKVRALLCGPCNNGLGCYKDDAELLIKAYNYLRNN